MDAANVPALPPPNGITPDFDHPQSRAIYTVVISGVCLALMGIFVSIRVYTRICITRAWTKDDSKISYQAKGLLLIQ